MPKDQLLYIKPVAFVLSSNSLVKEIKGKKERTFGQDKKEKDKNQLCCC